MTATAQDMACLPSMGRANKVEPFGTAVRTQRQQVALALVRQRLADPALSAARSAGRARQCRAALCPPNIPSLPMRCEYAAGLAVDRRKSLADPQMFIRRRRVPAR
jgi:hypothetical protein